MANIIELVPGSHVTESEATIYGLRDILLEINEASSDALRVRKLVGRGLELIEITAR